MNVSYLSFIFVIETLCSQNRYTVKFL